VGGDVYRVHFFGICDNITIGAALFCLKPASATLQSSQTVIVQLTSAGSVVADWDAVLPDDGEFIFDVVAVLDSVPPPVDDVLFLRVSHHTVRATIAGGDLVSTTNEVGSIDAIELEGPPPGFSLQTEVDSTAQSAPENAIPVHIDGRVVYKDAYYCPFTPIYRGLPLVKVKLDWDDDLDPAEPPRVLWRLG
jgi:hypothetical protein